MRTFLCENFPSFPCPFFFFPLEEKSIKQLYISCKIFPKVKFYVKHSSNSLLFILIGS